MESFTDKGVWQGSGQWRRLDMDSEGVSLHPPDHLPSVQYGQAAVTQTQRNRTTRLPGTRVTLVRKPIIPVVRIRKSGEVKETTHTVAESRVLPNPVRPRI
jgi:hypothetical protein